MSRTTTQAQRPRRALSNDGTDSARSSIPSRGSRAPFGHAEAAPIGRYAVMEAVTPSTEGRGLVGSGLAALTVSALGLAVAGGLTLTASAQEANPEALLEARGPVNNSPEVAEPAPAQPAAATEGEAPTLDSQADVTDPDLAGALDARSSDADSQTSRSAARAELDDAMSAELASQRSEQLSAAKSTTSEVSRAKALKSRASRLSSSSSSIDQENARLKQAEEQRKADEAAAAQAAADKAAGRPSSPAASAPAAAASGGASAVPGAVPSAAAEPESGTLSASAAKKATSSVASSSGSAPVMKSGSYTVGARYGAVGSWSRYHTGQDLPAPVGTPIYAAADGVVKPANGGGWAGTHVVIEHSDGGATLYAHMASTTVSPGQNVKAGQQIGYVGLTGRTFGAHLHWEYYPSASTVGNPYTTGDPMAWLSARGTNM